MDKVKAKQALEHLEKYLDNQEKKNKILNKIFGTSWFEGELGHLNAEQEAFYIDTLILLVGIHNEELEWFVYECQFGQSPLECKLTNGKIIRVDSIDTFLETV